LIATYEFESSLEHGVIKAPEALRYADGIKVRVLLTWLSPLIEPSP